MDYYLIVSTIAISFLICLHIAYFLMKRSEKKHRERSDAQFIKHLKKIEKMTAEELEELKFCKKCGNKKTKK